jgi:arylsulfatase A-like enzyme
MDPHDPYYPHPYDGTAYSRAANQKPDPADADKLRALYDGEITYWDEHFGQLVADLKRRGLYDDTLIVITSDHGEEFHDHGGFWHGTTLYDEQLRVPFVIKLPGQQQGGRVITHWVQSIDLMPSVLKVANLTVPKGVQGGDLFTGSDRAFAEESHEGNVLRALRIKRAGTELKLITANEGNPRGLAPSELYRTDQDPGEKINVALEDPSLTGFVRKELDTEEKQAGEGRAAQRTIDVSKDAASQEKLRALGYAGGDE